MENDTNVPTCPFCGVGMIEKPKLLDRKKYECICCGHSELKYNRVEIAIINGKMDDEITRQMARELCFRDIYALSEAEFEEEI